MSRILIAGGRVLDPGRDLDGAADVLVEDGRVAAVEPGLDASGAERLDATSASTRNHGWSASSAAKRWPTLPVAPRMATGIRPLGALGVWFIL